MVIKTPISVDYNILYTILDADNKKLFKVFDEQVANDIVRAVNSHAALVEALKRVSFISFEGDDEEEYCVNCGNSRSEGHNQECSIGRALRLARGETEEGKS